MTQPTINPTPPWLDCQVCHDTQRISTLSKDMIRSIRKLRRDLKACTSCSVDPADCPIRQNLSSQVQIAVQSVSDEWNLDSITDTGNGN